MQTFLPYPSLDRSAACLDRLRLGNQRLETKQIINTLLKKQRGESAGWQNHPAVMMWEGHIPALADYGLVCCRHWILRGYKDTQLDFFLETKDRAVRDKQDLSMPAWFGDERVHRSHRAALLRKDPEWYGLCNWRKYDVSREPWPEDYFWPVRKEKP